MIVRPIRLKYLVGLLLVLWGAILVAQPLQQRPAQQVELRGEVVAFDFASPISRITIDVASSDGRASRWTAETLTAVELRRAGWTSDSLVPGEIIVVRGQVIDGVTGVLSLKEVERVNGSVLRPQASSALGELTQGHYSLVPGRGYVRLSFNHQNFSTASFWFTRLQAGLDLIEPDRLPQNLQVDLLAEDLDSGSAELNRLLRSGTFFDASGFPLISFTSNRIEADTNNRYRVYGELTIKGLSRPVTLTALVNEVGAHPLTGNPGFGISARAILNRSEWDLGQFSPGVGLEVGIEVEAEFELSSSLPN